jgi:hypothetical protein
VSAGAPFPATSWLDLYVDVSAPESPLGPLRFHNEAALRLVPWAGESETTIDWWPPLGVTYRLIRLLGVDNDGDGLVDEDSADEDRDGLIDEDGPGPDRPPGANAPCGDDADCDGRDGEDPPPLGCGALCDEDGDGRVDEDGTCVPLLNEDNSHGKLGLCAFDVQLQFAPRALTYSVARGGPSGLHPADLLALTPAGAGGEGQAPFVRVRCAGLGLTAAGCRQSETPDDIDALSFGADLAGPGSAVLFSVGPGAQGSPGSAVEGQRQCPPAQPGGAPEPESDVFASARDGTSSLLFDGNGPIGSCEPAYPLGLVEGATVRDDVNALAGQDPSVVDADGDGVPERPIYLSLSEGSPSLASLGFTAADVLMSVGGEASLYASSSSLGLQAGDDLDALCVQDDGDGRYQPGRDVVYYALTPRSPSLALIGAGPGDLLAPGALPVAVQRGTGLGLAISDDLDAMHCEMLVASAPQHGDVSCDGRVDGADALLILQYSARLSAAPPCLSRGDVNQDGAYNSMDAALILQAAAGLIGALPR